MVVLGWRSPFKEAAAELRAISRVQAIARGLPRYFTGKPCRAGHTAERTTVDNTCVECTRERFRRSRAAIRKAIKEATP